jgi:uncharacterized protein YfaS (alpha-2-macroglobulin family)
MTRRFLFLLVLLACASASAAQEASSTDDTGPAFSLSTSETFTTRDAPHFFLTFRRVEQLDIRVYRVRDPFRFFAGLPDPHQFGTDAPLDVPQERSWFERLTAWKRSQRSRIRHVLRAQVSPRYRAARRVTDDRTRAAQRVQLDVSTFAQVPLLNPDHLVTSWRELLPNHRDPEFRRIPFPVDSPGLYLVEATHDRLRAYTVVVVSDVGLVTKISPGELLLFAADRFTGEPRAGCQVQAMVRREAVASGTTAPDGTWRASLPGGIEQILGLAQCGDAIAVTDPGAYALQSPSRELVGYLYTDKSIYRPGQTLHMKGIVRWREQDALRPFDAATVEVVASDPNDKVLVRRQMPVDAFGAVALSFPIPATGALGSYTLRVQSGEQQALGAFEVQEYRKPEFEVTVTPVTRMIVQGQSARVTVQARYYFGQPVANGRVQWVLNQQPYFSPLRWDEGAEEGGGSWYGGDQTAQGEARLDESGRAELVIPVPPGESARDFTARIEARVTDASAREVSGATQVVATWGRFLIAGRADRSIVKAGERVELQLRAIDYAGQPQARVPMAIELDRLTYPEAGYGEPTATRLSTSSAMTGDDGRTVASVTMPAGATGPFRLTLATEADGRRITDQLWLFVPGPQSSLGEETGDRFVELVADRKIYAPGDTARLLLRGDTVTGAVLATKEGQHVSWHQVLRLTASDAIEIPVTEGDVGDMYVNLVYMRDGRLYRAERRLSVPAATQMLQVAITADQAVSRPQEPGRFTVQVTDHTGAPVRAQVSLAVIDEAVYGVRPDATPDPVRYFYRRDFSRVNTSFSREYFFTGFSGVERLQLAQRRRRPMTLADFKGDRPSQPAVRKEFPDAIYWIPDIETDTAGRAQVAVRYPDALTTWRLTARAVTTDTRVGSGVARTTVTKDLIVRVVPPRFLTEGDALVLPAIVHNYRPDTRTASVSLTASGLEATSDRSRVTDIRLASGGEARHDFSFSARTPGMAIVTAEAETESDRDAVEISLPVHPFGVRRTETAAGSVIGAGEASAELVVPASANPAGRRITVSVAPSLAGSMLGALDYLTGYPYGCTEQTVSSFVPNVLVTRALTALQLAPTERLGALDRQISSGLRRLGDMQHDDGGWGWWKSDGNHPFMSAYALWAMDEARRTGARVDTYRIDTGARALARMYVTAPRALPDLKVYMAYVLKRALPDSAEILSWAESGSITYSHAAALNDAWAARGRMSPLGQAQLVALLDEHGDARATQAAQELLALVQTKGELSWWAADNDALLFDAADTSVEATAFAVQALARRTDTHAVLERAVRWLLLNRQGSHWGTTKRTAMALYGLLAFMQARNERATATGGVDVFVNGALAGRHVFSARDMVAAEPMQFNVDAQAGANTVRLVTREGGAVYWAAAATFFDAQAAEGRIGSRQLAVTRAYTRLVPVSVNARIVYREQAFDGTAAPGDVLLVRLTAAGSTDWRYLSVDDPLPAGVESVRDPSAYPLETPDRVAWWWGSQVEYRDNRTVFFQQDFDRGRYEYVYLVKVTTEGTFRVAPTQVSPMYIPQVSASSAPMVLTVTPGGRP